MWLYRLLSSTLNLLVTAISLALDCLNLLRQARVSHLLTVILSYSVAVGLLLAHALLINILVVIVVSLAQNRWVESGDIKDGAGVLASLLVIIVLSLVVYLFMEMLLNRGRVRGRLLCLLVFVHWHGIWLRNGDRNLFMDFNDLGNRHGNMLHNMNRIGDSVRNFDSIGYRDFNRNCLCNPYLLWRQMVLANIGSQMLKLLLCMNQMIATVLVAVTIGSSTGHSTQSGHANDTEYLQRTMKTRLDIM